ncbi:MAG: SPOR domain-containing protein [Lewinellaceae bacterium]|nr:SPOR domain-containing protein [Lewinella sp.]MCB9280470.1 SPOR domain-containing protein [Lewinellaceae bacterium]HMQ91002.1 SPOR domain-containing protein [Flavilitoribacter sp.]
MRLFKIAAFLLCLLPALSNAQNIQYVEEPLITEMMEKFVTLNKSKVFLQGWRIQIMATPDRQKVEAAKATFRYRYPNIPVDWVHDKPWYKLQAGAFASKLEALRLKNILSQEYSGLYPVQDDRVTPQELINAAY